MRSTFLLHLAYLCFLWNITASSKRDNDDDSNDDDDDDDDDARGKTSNGRAADIRAVEAELSGLERDLRMGERKFEQLWHVLRASSRVINDPTLRTIRNQTQRMRRDLSRGFRSLNDFMNCLDLCHTSHHDDDHQASEAQILYFCNNSCLMVVQGHAAHALHAEHAPGDGDDDDTDNDHSRGGDGDGGGRETTLPSQPEALVG